MRFRSEAPPQSPRPIRRAPLPARRFERPDGLRLVALASLMGWFLLTGMFVENVSAENSPARKLGRGLANLSLGVMAIPSEVIDTTKESGPALGVTWGFLKGTAMMVVTESVGLWEMMTCPFATPPDYLPILSPEFPWQRFTAQKNQRSKRKVRTGSGGGRRVRE